MTRTRKVLLVVAVVVAGICVTFAVLSFRPVSDGRTPEEQHRIAEACFSVLRSSLANEGDIKPDDPRLPQIIRGLGPVMIMVDSENVVVLRGGKPAEYHLARKPGTERTWILYIAGPGYVGHRELLRMEHD